MRVLVTGASGFLGHATVRRLLADGHEVLAVSRSGPGSDDGRAADRGGPDRRSADDSRRSADHRSPAATPTWLRGDLRVPAFAAAAVRDADAVVHLAALTRLRDSFDRPEEFADVNVGGTRNLLAAVAARGVPLPFVHSSSAAVYGTPARQPVAEDCPPAPTSPYGETKLAADLALRAAAERGTVGGVSLRVFNLSGAVDGRADRDLTRVIPKAVAVAAGRFPELTVNGDGRAVRDFVHVADAADAVALALGHARPGRFDVFNLGAAPACVAEIIAMVEQASGRRVPVRHNPPAPEAAELRSDSTLARGTLGWTPSRSTLERIVADAWSAAED